MKTRTQRLPGLDQRCLASILRALVIAAAGSSMLFASDDGLPAKVFDPPIIDEQPMGRVATEGGPVAFSILAHSPKLLKYQWQKDGVPLTNSARLTGATTGVCVRGPT